MEAAAAAAAKAEAVAKGEAEEGLRVCAEVYCVQENSGELPRVRCWQRQQF